MESDFDEVEKNYSVLIWRRVMEIYRSNTNGTNQILYPFGLSNAQMDVICRVGEYNRISQKELASKLVVTKGNITQLLQKLEKDGYISREREWKTNYLSLTEKGNDLYIKFEPELVDFQRKYFNCLTIDDKENILRILNKLE
ncbi:MarR family winged helix-turn-helix transcriptional regulator [Bacillus mesophilum]|uniref:MarR family transcriptional regulator n=1 Tax=Bacillus mesophilum TaxID=1071718 RepID=A0A7V7RPD8_9BACI|nr:MarR family transcriptional regulator [Bacillus mesophilum]KAB2335129.1 MarR family transcriptional regulator [Bacillus mesophilum]